MKKISILLAASLFMIASCRKEEAVIGEPFSKSEGIKGTWILDKVHQVDEASPLKDFRDISEFYGLDNSGGTGLPVIQINFNAADHSFKMTTGTGKNFMAPGFKDPLSSDTLRLQGNWSFVNELNPSFADEAPEGVRLINDLTDTVDLALQAPIRPFDQELALQIVRCKLSYIYYFKRKN